MIVEYTRSFDKNFSNLPADIQIKSREVIKIFIDCYASQQFPKSLRIHKCGPFVSISITMRYRIFLLPIDNGIKFVFVGDHKDAEDYLKK